MAQRKIDMRFTLKDPITWNGQKVTELELVSPNVKMIRQNGYPVIAGTQALDPEACSLYMADMSGIPIDGINFVSAKDFVRFGEVLLSFFIEPGSQENQ